MIISFYANRLNSGKKTLALSFANEAAKKGYKVLLIDLDYSNTSFAQTYGITHKERNTENYLISSLTEGYFNLESNVIRPKEAQPSLKELKKGFEHYSDNLYFMTISEDFLIEHFTESPMKEWSTQQCFDYMKRFVSEIQNSDYDVTVLVLPVGIDDVFALPLILFSDKCVNVFKFNVKQVEEVKKMLTAFDTTTNQKFLHVLNETSKRIEKKDYELMCSNIKLSQIIPFDELRGVNDINAIVGSPLINTAASNLIAECGLEIAKEKSKKWFQSMR